MNRKSLFPTPSIFDAARLAVPIPEAAARCGVSPEFIRREIRAGRLRALKGCRPWVVPVSELRLWIQDRAGSKGPAA